MQISCQYPFLFFIYDKLSKKLLVLVSSFIILEKLLNRVCLEKTLRIPTIGRDVILGQDWYSRVIQRYE